MHGIRLTANDAFNFLLTRRLWKVRSQKSVLIRRRNLFKWDLPDSVDESWLDTESKDNKSSAS